jgi:hypothetical protein
MAGVLGSIWCVLNGTGNLLGGLIGDYIGRKKQISESLLLPTLAFSPNTTL